MAETYARPRFGEPREPKTRVNPGSRLVGVLDFATQSNARAVAFLLVCGLLLFLPGFFNIPPIDRDEARFAQATKQMVETDDFVDIRFQDEVRYKKPVGIYWLQAAAVENDLGNVLCLAALCEELAHLDGGVLVRAGLLVSLEVSLGRVGRDDGLPLLVVDDLRVNVLR